jgi:alkanesulfonate monooxygenase SsuD/methylene tetrahydromethanopterin reductase-like flavin-dependent oxidoreductase (luciferase family)
MPALREGIAAGSRHEKDVAIVPEVIVAVGRDEQELEASTLGARALVGFYASTPAYRPVLEVEGRGDLQPQLQELARRGDPMAMGAAIDDELLDLIAVRGTPAECARLIAAKLDGLSDRVCAYFVGARPADDTIAELVAEVHALPG